jgi:hypothetical protein
VKRIEVGEPGDFSDYESPEKTAQLIVKRDYADYRLTEEQASELTDLIAGHMAVLARHIAVHVKEVRDYFERSEITFKWVRTRSSPHAQEEDRRGIKEWHSPNEREYAYI